MKKEMYVSLWLGNRKSEEDLENYVGFDYSDDVTASEFSKDFDVNPDEIDEDFFESAYLPESSGIISILLMGCSYEKEVIGEFERKIGDKLPSAYNSVILVYDYQYTRKIPAHSPKSHFEFIDYVKISYQD